MARTAMARPKRKPGGSKGPDFKTIGFRVSVEFDEWLNALAEEYRTTRAGILDRAVTEWARSVGYKKPPPKR